MKDFGVYVYRWDLGDCSMDGITSNHERLLACWNDDDIFCWPEDMGNSDVVIKADIVCGKRTLRAFVIDKDTGSVKKGGMFGGNFIYCSDSRFPSLPGEFSSPVSVHDRFESQEISDMLSR